MTPETSPNATPPTDVTRPSARVDDPGPRAPTDTEGVSVLRPELRAVLEANWARNEAAYRYLGK